MIHSTVQAAPWLSVIMPVHYGEKWIQSSLQSIVSEKPIGVEVIVIDSSLPATCLDIAERVGGPWNFALYSRPDLLTWQDKTNFGATVARASHLCWLHQDDLWLPGRLAAVRAWIAKAPDRALHLAPCAIIDHSGRRLGIWRCPFASPGSYGTAQVLRRFLVQNFVGVPAPVFRTDACQRVGGLDGELWYTADWDLWLKLASVSPVEYHDELTAAFRIHDGSLTMTGRKNIEDFEKQMRVVFERHLPCLGDQSGEIERLGRVSIAINVALASASMGDRRRLIPAFASAMKLGPVLLARYLYDSRLRERLMPRVYAKLRGTLRQ